MKQITFMLLTAILPGTALAQELTAHGSFRHMMHSGETGGTVALDTLTVPSAWGVGATAGLRGEVVIRDGAILVSRGTDPEARVTPPEPGEEAVILAYGAVSGWQTATIPHDMAPDGLAQFVEGQAESLGLDLAGGFPIRVQGRFSQLVWHVVTGEATAKGGQGDHGSGHANSRSGMNLYDEPGASGEIVGIYTGTALEGVASHPGDRLHLHFVSADGARSGHVDEVVIPGGSTLLLPVPAADGAAPLLVAPSPYAGMEGREIKSLSAEDIEDLRAGRGWGLALAAELNGVPGPSHLLEMREELGLSPEQVTAIEAIFSDMKAEAQVAGARLIAAEAAIEAAFRAGDLTPEALRDLIDAAAAARAELRFIHLARHLETSPLLTAEQIGRYNHLRGYGAADPCANVPEGHDAAMWRRHNNCE